jgi:ElaB/YqjD/DUF883 family membrane-anchored ribosome-binding protein
MQQPSEGGATGSELASDAKQLGNSAANRIHSEVDSRKSDAADQVRSVSTAIQNAAGGLDANAPSWLKSAFQQGAQQVQRFADALDHKDSRQLINEVQDFARERPAMFLGACAAAGFAAARIFKAGGEQQSGGSQSQQFGGGQSSGQRFRGEQQSGGQQFGSQGSQQFGGGTQVSGQRIRDDADSTTRGVSGPSSGEFAR